MTVVGAILRYSQIQPGFVNSSHGQPPSTRPPSSFSAEDRTLFIVLPDDHVWAPHTRQRAVFSKSSRSRASTTVVVDHDCPEGCRGHPSYLEGIHVPLLRKVRDMPSPERSRTSSWQHFTDRSSRVLPRRLSRLIQRCSQDIPDTKPAFTPSLEQAFDSRAQQYIQSPTNEERYQTLDRRGSRRKDDAGAQSL